MEPNFTRAPQDTAEFDQIMAESESCLHHRRAFSDQSFDDLVDNDFEFEFNHCEFDMPNFPPPPPPPPAAVVGPVDSMSLEASTSRPGSVGPSAGLDRGKSVDSNNLDGVGMAGDGNNKVERRRRHSISVDSSWMLSLEGAAVSLAKKAMDSEQLAELARVDPKRVKRILANRQSAAKSKEKKTHYASELQEKVQLLRTKADDLFTNVSML
ncbi:Transcription factor RF2b, partial [Mucuna pruriens]